jgi:hypothetical protein
MYEFIRPFLEIFLLLFEIIIITLTIRVKNKKIKFLFTFMNLFVAIFLYQNAVKFAGCICGGFDDLMIQLESVIIMFIFIIQLMISIFKK